nr:hypothetical protein [Candidatus Sigynarchaeota archaeon]
MKLKDSDSIIKKELVGNEEKRWLEAYNKDINDLSELDDYIEKFPDLLSINLAGNHIKHLDHLLTWNLPQLTGIRLDQNELDRVPDVFRFPQLGFIDISNNHIREIDELYGLDKLIRFKCSYNRISSISQLLGLTALKELDIAQNQIVSIQGIERLVHLEKLDIGYNQIVSIKGIEYLHDLVEFSIYNNQISDITPLSGLTKLESLALGQNCIESFRSIMKLPNLIKLSLVNNKIKKLSEEELAFFHNFPNSKSSSVFNLNGNPLVHPFKKQIREWQTPPDEMSPEERAQYYDQQHWFCPFCGYEVSIRAAWAGEIVDQCPKCKKEIPPDASHPKWFKPE